jgi:hypothetical protein
LTARSPVFLKMFDTNTVEAKDGVLKIKDMSGEAMEKLLLHIYTGSFDGISDLNTDEFVEILNAANKVQKEEMFS